MSGVVESVRETPAVLAVGVVVWYLLAAVVVRQLPRCRELESGADRFALWGCSPVLVVLAVPFAVLLGFVTGTRWFADRVLTPPSERL